MFYVQLIIGGECKYLLTHRTAVYHWGYAKKFKTRGAAERYMKNKQVAKERICWVVER